MRIGYSFWGFLGPDGGCSHRRTLIHALLARGHEMVFLQPDRDLIETGVQLHGRYIWDVGLPDLDALMLEWRWPIPGRNTTWCGAAGHICDLHRQTELVAHYVERLGLPAVIWDRDRKLPPHDRLRRMPNVTIREVLSGEKSRRSRTETAGSVR
jgi:hypothetical protein